MHVQVVITAMQELVNSVKPSVTCVPVLNNVLLVIQLTR